MIVITGGSDGLGLQIAILLASHGKNVVSLSRTKPKQDNIDWIKTDLLDDISITKAVEELLERSDSIEALINCAAVTSYEDLDELSPSELDRMFKTNVTAPMLLTSKLLSRIKQDGADVINIGATIALKAGYAGQSVYSTTKWALRGFTQNLSEELKSTSCRVVSVILGGFYSNMHKKVTGQEIVDPENWMKTDDIAKVISQILDLPQNMEISEIVINRKARRQ
jgi:short-subunit dehydrogenase